MKKVYLLILSAFMFIQLNSCSDNITSGCDTGAKEFEGTFSEIQSEIFTPYCVGCHGNTQPSGNLNLTTARAYGNLINQTAQASDLSLVNPGNVGQSYLMKRLNAEGGESPMPPAGKLPQELIDLVALWIEQGALEN